MRSLAFLSIDSRTFEIRSIEIEPTSTPIGLGLACRSFVSFNSSRLQVTMAAFSVESQLRLKAGNEKIGAVIFTPSFPVVRETRGLSTKTSPATAR